MLRFKIPFTKEDIKTIQASRYDGTKRYRVTVHFNKPLPVPSPPSVKARKTIRTSIDVTKIPETIKGHEVQNDGSVLYSLSKFFSR